MDIAKLGIGKSHAKIILFGEHAVVYQEPGISIPIKNLNVTVTIRPAYNGQLITGQNFSGNLEDLGANFEGLRQLILKLLVFFNSSEMPFTLDIQTNIPPERGLGASAALATAVTRAFFDYFDTKISSEMLQEFANFEEAVTHGTPSGLDVATVSSDSPVWFIKNQLMEPFNIKLDAYLVIADTGVHSQTSLPVSVIKQALRTNKKSTLNTIHAIGSISCNAKMALMNDSAETLGLLMDKNHQLLKSLGVSHPKLERLIATAKKAGALGAKLTGAGAGGCMIALADNNMSAVTIANSLVADGANHVWIEKLTN